MTEKTIDIIIPLLGKQVVTATIKADESVSEATSASAAFARALVAGNRLKDVESGLNPPRPSHEIVRGPDQVYRLKRLRFY